METPFSGKTIGFIGAGNMAEAMIHALRERCDHPAGKLLAADPSPKIRERMKKLFGISATENNTEVFLASDILVLAVKPQQMKSVLEKLAAEDDFRKSRGRKLVISIAAGIPLSFLRGFLKKSASVENENITLVRVMPNTPSLVGEGMAGISPEETAADDDIRTTLFLMETMGRAVLVPENLMDSVTALSGSGPAYLFLLAEAMAGAGKEMGLDQEIAALLAAQTLKGAAVLLEKSGEDMKSLRQKVTSPGGTTAAAISVFEEGGFARLVENAMRAAGKRSMELAPSAENRAP